MRLLNQLFKLAFLMLAIISCDWSLSGIGGCRLYAATIYTDRLVWEATVSGPLITDDFNSYTISTAPTIEFKSGVVSDNTFKPTLSYPKALNAVHSSKWFGGINSTGAITWRFPWEINAFGFEAFSFNNTTTLSGNFDGLGEVSFNIGSYLPLSVNGNYSGFLGIVGIDKFDTLTFTNSLDSMYRDSFTADDLSFTASPVPEPSTIVLLSGGLTGLVFVARRRRKE